MTAVVATPLALIIANLLYAMRFTKLVSHREKGVRNLFWPLLDHRRFGFTVFPYLLALPAGLTGKGS
jgi:hypothetical protein